MCDYPPVREDMAVSPKTTQRPMEISKTDLQKIMAYLNDAARLYDALPMQSLKSRGHMIRMLVNKLKAKQNAKPK